MLLDELRAVVADSSSDVLIATDFDGTLAPIVDDPASAVPFDGAAQLLERLAGHVAEVAVISGRPLTHLRRFLPDSLTLVGLYGLEAVRRGESVTHPSAGVWRETIADVARGAELRGPRLMRVELKELSLTLHYREHPEIADEVERYAAGAAKDARLRVRPARMSIELHPPIDEDKGTTLERLAADHDGPVVFIGDDVGDVPAFAVLGRLAEAGRLVARVAVDSDELPDELRDQADLVVAGPAGVAELLTSLLP